MVGRKAEENIGSVTGTLEDYGAVLLVPARYPSIHMMSRVLMA